ncbi:mannitol dehydrogenase family protein [Leptolyngbya sp. DQ-M1]|uniref:mannitol dehydrogenase family protein n=1 Tax=Leptolyngbya sp. DQ-M1 TaxID=2933920 RepID=UPI00329A640E
MKDYFSLSTRSSLFDAGLQTAGIAPATVTELWKQQSPYNRSELNIGIVHFGPGRFFRAHLARIIHQHLAQKDLQWGICGVSLRSHRTIEHLQPQDFLYTLTELYIGDEHHESADVIGSIKHMIDGAAEPSTVLELMESPTVHLVTLTVTQAGYCLDSRFALDINHPGIVHDLKHSTHPTTAIGFIVEALRRRRDRGIAPFTTLSCDNLPRNGEILQRAVLTYAEQVDSSLAEYIVNNATFPNTVVDRIVPQAHEADKEHSYRLLQVRDRSPIVTEPFWQFVVEDKFSSDRPMWEEIGVTMTDDITPFLHLKSRFLNAVHSFIACLAVRGGIECVHQALRLPEYHLFLRLLMDDITAATPVVDSMCEQYVDQVLLRLSNEATPDKIERIAAETSRKIGKYIAPILKDAHAQGVSLRRLMLPIAAWMLTIREGASELGQSFEANDKPEVIAAIQTGKPLSEMLGLEPGECCDLLDLECDRAMWEIRTRGLSATLRYYSQEHFEHDIVSAA